MTPPDMCRNPIEQLADEFLARYRRGERPAVSEYADRYPELADEIRDLFPALVLMEEAGPRDNDRPATICGTAPERVGDYRILREIGRGGMGIVYEAEHEALGRRVALKMLPTYSLMDSRHLARFRREARAAARLHHTNIVPVFGVGEQDGLHFYVMQFIQGLGLDEVLVELRRQRAVRNPVNERIGEVANDNPAAPLSASGFPALRMAESLVTGIFKRDEPRIAVVSDKNNETAANLQDESAGLLGRPDACSQPDDAPQSTTSSGIQLPGQEARTTLSDTGQPYWQSVARIGVQVADALDYANGQGVLHRDIKPANLLLDSQGTVWVTDFGLAKAADSDDLTNTGDILGTLRYIAPERLHGQSDVRGDIYSLGVTLYELLTLRPAVDDSDRNQLVRKLSDEEPARPRTIEPAIPRDLETIVLKAIAKDARERYQSASELAADLRQFLEDRPIQARRAGRSERVWRWCRRNRLVAGLAAAVAVLVLVLGAGATIAHLLRTERDRAVASESRTKDAEVNTRILLARAEAAETENKIRSHLASATAMRRTGQTGQRFGCLEEVAQAMRLNPSSELRRQLRNEAIAALSLTDVKIRWQRPASEWVGVSIDRQFERYAGTDPVTLKTVVRGLTDDHPVLRMPAPRGGPWWTATEFSPDGNLLATVYFLSNDDAPLLEIWRIDRGERIHRARIHSGAVTAAVAFHPNGRWVVYCLPTKDLCVWDLAENREVRRVPLGLRPYSICLDSKGDRAAANDVATGTVKIVDLQTGSELATWPSQSSGIAMAWSADDKLLAAASNQRIAVWNVPRGELMSVLDGHTSGVIWVQFARRGHMLATASWDGTTRLWDVISGEALLMATGAGLRFSDDDRQLAFIDNEQIGMWDLAGGRERRTIHSSLVGNRNSDGASERLTCAEFIGNGRLFATSSTDGVNLWDNETFEELGRLDVGDVQRTLLHPRGECLLTIGVAGLLRWPIKCDSTEEQDHWHIGPPQVLYDVAATSPCCYDVTWLPDCRGVAINDPSRSEVLIIDDATADSMSPPIRLPNQSGNRNLGIEVSPDGKWIAIGGFKAEGVQVWNAATHEIECVLPARFEETGDDTIFWVHFSPDNRWLACQASNGSSGGVGYYFWRVGSWERAHFVGATNTTGVGVTFSHSGRMAASVAQHEIMVADAADGRELVRLSTLPVLRAWPTGFDREGGKLVTLAMPDTVHVWDLRLVRRQLAMFDLDWEDTSPDQDSAGFSSTQSVPISPASQNGSLPPDLTSDAKLPYKPLRLTIDSSDTRQRIKLKRGRLIANDHYGQAIQHQRAGRWKDAIAELEEAIAWDPGNAPIQNDLAWLLATCSDLNHRDIPRAVEHAKRAVELDPSAATSHNTLGVCLSRAGDWRRAIEELTEAEDLAPGKYFGHNAFFLAISHWQLDESVSARTWLERGIEWQDKNAASLSPSVVAELVQFRAEAETLIGNK